jgi:anti-anti-sigma regulatory factor
MIDLSVDEGVQVITPQNDIEGEESHQFCDVLEKITSDGTTKIRLDFSNVNQIDAAALCGLILLRNITQAEDIEMVKMDRTTMALMKIIRAC